MLALSPFIHHSDHLAFFTFGSALQAVDDALSSAAGVKKKTSKEVDEAFEGAISVLGRYEAEFHPKKPALGEDQVMTVHERIEKAKAKDKSSSAILNVIKEKLSLRVGLRKLHLPAQY